MVLDFRAVKESCDWSKSCAGTSTHRPCITNTTARAQEIAISNVIRLLENA